MPVSATVPRALADIFETPSDEEDFEGFRGSLPRDAACSEDSRDSLRAALRFRSKYITEELAKIFAEDTDPEEEEFEGFTEAELELNHRMKSMSMDSTEDSEEEEEEEEEGFCSEGEAEAEAPARRRSSSLCVAFRFPVKKSRPGRKPAEGRGRRDRAASGSESEDEGGPAGAQPSALQRRAKNIKENKEMLAKLLAELNAMPDLFPVKTPTKKRKSPKKPCSEAPSGRRNPSRSARPPEHFGIERLPVSPSKILEQLRGASRGAGLRKRLLEVSEEPEHSGGAPRRRSSKHGEARPVEDITEEELENVAYSSKDKVYDKEHGSTCHQCRQKTLDTKTVCRNPNCWGVRGQFCGPCLRNRYGEDVRSALRDPLWVCPPCRGICNCSFCRKRDGRCATGILIHMAKFYGHNNVREYLESLQKHLTDEN
ncbi:cell division cycle-associated 7-like protein [Lepisosteus oculatus]|uniref:cell division cycle-associated 7-like protein n=1 Tax=Lepisosteus oculatus TaxID=7918 RepID=UPI0035F51AD7